MEFGHVYELLDEVDFTLKPDTDITRQTLSGSKRESNLQVYIGASKFGEKSWKGKIYPKALPDNQFLNFYSKNFNTVEFGPTVYRFFTADEIHEFSRRVDNPDFKFCPRFPQSITHIRRLANAETQTAQFFDSLAGFGNHLGPLLLQLGEYFSPKSFPNLKNFIASLDPNIKVSLEVRHKDWYANADHRRDLLNLLSDNNLGTVISDTSGRRDCVHMDLTTPDAFIRFVGNNLAPSDYKRMDDWVDRIKVWSDMGLRSLWFFMHQNDESFVPEASLYFINQLNTKLGLNIKPPTLITSS